MNGWVGWCHGNLADGFCFVVAVYFERKVVVSDVGGFLGEP